MYRAVCSPPQSSLNRIALSQKVPACSQAVIMAWLETTELLSVLIWQESLLQANVDLNSLELQINPPLK